MRIGIFGGTFNPIHVAHLTLAEEARLAAQLDRVILIPSGDPYLKDPSEIAPQADRLEMVRLASAGRYEVSDIEIRRQGPSYTAVTCAQLRALYPDDQLSLILGADSLMEIERWRDPQTIFDTVTVLAFTRGGEDDPALFGQAEHLRSAFGARIRIIDAFDLELSSSDIRRWIREGHAFRHLVTAPVGEYIEANGLYGYKQKG
ncbi:MAG: nicotinate-nucleotide adenylyltransferase [Clostridia bacterium]|nr:nicotinate-nucleotide adenylyltransferase [Clostridia bacterium]